jgi:hypothetical protein
LFCLSLSAALAAQQSTTAVMTKPWEKFLGSWKLVPGPDGSTSTKIEPESDGGVKISFGCKQDGSCPSNIIVKYDGKLYKYSNYSEDAKYEASFRKIGDRTMQQDWYFNGKQGATHTWQLSPGGGDTLTRTDQVVSPPGSKKITYMYDRSGGPKSTDDPFIGFWKRDWNKGDAWVLTYTSKEDVLELTDSLGRSYARNCDGKDHPNSASPAGGLYSCRFSDALTYEVVLKESGKVFSTVTGKISDDGRRMVRTGKNAEGKPESEETYEKIK